MGYEYLDDRCVDSFLWMGKGMSFIIVMHSCINYTLISCKWRYYHILLYKMTGYIDVYIKRKFITLWVRCKWDILTSQFLYLQSSIVNGLISNNCLHMLIKKRIEKDSELLLMILISNDDWPRKGLHDDPLSLSSHNQFSLFLNLCITCIISYRDI